MFSLNKKRTVPRNEAQTTKLVEGIGLIEDSSFFLENIIFEEQNQLKN